MTAVADGDTLTVERGALGTSAAPHAASAVVRAVEVCRKQTVRVAPAETDAQTATGGIYLGLTKNAVCHSFSGATARDGRQCTLEVGTTNELLRSINAGDVVRRNSGTPNATSLSRSARAVSNSHSDAQ